MDSGRRGKRKSPSKDIIFEVSDNDISADNSEDDCKEPEAKISKISTSSFILQLNDVSNLENTTGTDTLNLDISVNQEQESFVEISEHISVSNSSSGNNSRDGSDIIVISEDNIDVVNDSEENNCSTSQIDYVQNSQNSIDSYDVIDITGDNTACLSEQGPASSIEENVVCITEEINVVSTTEENPVSLCDENPVSSSDRNHVSLSDKYIVTLPDDGSAACLNDDHDCLEEREADGGQVEMQDDDPIIDVVTKSPSIDIEHEEQVNSDEVDTTAESDSCICITFSNEKMAELYKLKFLKFLQQFVDLEVTQSEGLSIRIERDSILNPNEWVVMDNTVCLIDSKEFEELEKLASPLPPTPQPPHPKKRKKKKNKKEKELFVLDTNPSVNEHGAQNTKYSTKFHININEKTAEDEIVRISTQTCFNCESNHALKDCPLPKDFARINAARQKFKKTQKTLGRYHLEEDQKYSHLEPGKISDKLRQALGLRKNELPPFIYHMRILGYPPGWLEEAKIIHSNLAMFDSDGNSVQGSSQRKSALDPEKIINYYGFNVPADKNIKDEYRNYRVPPYSDMFNKQAMIDFFEKNYAKEQDNLETCDMDIDTNFENKPSNALINELKEVGPNLPSPSLVDLEKEKQNLLAALEEHSSSNSKSVATILEEGETCSDQEKSNNEPVTSEKVGVDEPLQINVDKTEDLNTSLLSPPLNSSVNSVKTSMFGTPILKSSSPYSKLPNPDNFMKDVSPVINFENLPNSTGKYEQMTGVLQKVRSTLKNLQNCKS